jgi:murein DD-endopeptidase MepM/ murein hydrolase activator NlpD
VPPPRLLLLSITGLALGLAACDVEHRDRSPLVRFTAADSTLACGAFDVPPEDSVSRRILFAARHDTPATARDTSEGAVPNPREVNPPEVDVEGAPPSPEAAAPAAGLLIPVAGVRTDELVDTYTAARGQGRVHNAIDILAPRGVPVLAAARGRVVRLFESVRGGLTLYQLGPDGETVYYYAHLDGYHPDLEAGHTVQRGDTLGFVGDSGNAAPGNTHLHFAMWTVTDPAQFWDGEPINPYPLLRGEGAGPTGARATGASRP